MPATTPRLYIKTFMKYSELYQHFDRLTLLASCQPWQHDKCLLILRTIGHEIGIIYILTARFPTQCP